ncbi:hypothetical protein [Actinokineospora cianjurensis]|uniref:Uncharacterized protein n=1 Tax=Actinokineospora cianjurensis TaxID=585224 RepID=A0A421AUG9_9PSEU|nr:hypothetical protein [Actinokineospora cianjurensis]RLK53553.1 hypothetical protein CLV68_6720 [Actinokineospora cianjurensis]
MSGYAYGQWLRALATLGEGGRGAAAKARKWRAVLDGISTGQVTVGSRTPVTGVPPWVTVEVVHGGFATGRLLAEQPLTGHDRARLRAAAPGSTERERQNLQFLSDAGQAELLEALRSGQYRIDLPEEAAIPVAVALFAAGRDQEAFDLLEAIWPWIDRLKFTPTFDAIAVPSGDAVRVRSVGSVMNTLEQVTVPAQIAAMRETVTVWNPRYERLVALWARTVDGALPSLRDGAVVGGWPCTRWPDDWAEQRERWLADLPGPVTGRHAHPRSNFARLHAALLLCPHDSADLGPRQVGWIRRALANALTTPRAVEPVESSTYADIAARMAERLRAYPRHGGIPAVEPITADLDPPAHLVTKLSRALDAPAADLVRRGVLTSSEAIAAVLPQRTSRLAAGRIADPVLATLHERTYTAFRDRRSLLLLNLAKQVQFTELPWVVADPEPRPDDGSARRALRETVELVFTAFPHTITPNPLVTELRTLARLADLDLPLVEEVAADIFMGRFTDKWRAAAVVASRTMHDTLYAHYYDLPTSWPTPFADLCHDRAVAAGAPTSYVASNGAVLEQSQILTTHNLAVLTDALDLTPWLRASGPDLARRVLNWIARRGAQRAVDRHTALVQVKNIAYAWRQAVFFLSFCPADEQRALVQRLADHPDLTHVVRGLEYVIAGGRFGAAGSAPGGGRRLLGWVERPAYWPGVSRR